MTPPISPPVTAVDAPEPADRAARFGLRSGLGLVVLAVGGASFLILWLLVREHWGPLAAADAGVAEELNQLVNPHPLVVTLLAAVTDLGGTGTAVLLISLAAVFARIRGRRRLALFAVVTGIGLAVLVPVTKALIDRARPVVAVPVVDTPGNASFPSGHATTAIVTWGLLLVLVLPSVRRRARPWLVAAAAAVVLAVGLTRLALGVHFVSDVLAGWVLGASWLAVTVSAFRAWQHDRGTSAHRPLDPLGVPATEAVALAPAAQATLPEGRATAGRLAAGAVAVWAVLTALGLLVTGALGDSWVGRVDRAVTRWFVGQRTGTWTTVADAASALAGTRAVLAVGLSAAVIALAVTSSRRPAVFVVVVLLGEVLLYGAVSQVVGRVRPTVADLTGNLPTGASWPSGHVAAAAALYGALAVLAVVHGRGRRRWTTMALPVLVAVAVAMSRLYVAAHYTTDVLAGLALGTAWVLLCARLLLRPASDGVGADAAGHGTDQMDAVQPGGRADRPG